MLAQSKRLMLLAAVCVLPVVVMAQRPAQNGDWRATLRRELPLLGHRNWIAIVDSAYPLQTSAGIETIETGSDHVEVVRAVLEQIARSKHVRPVIFTDSELQFVPESEANGVSPYREALGALLAKTPAQSLPHEEIISKLDDAGKTFHVLVLKSTMTIPYTSVFIRLDCGYWTAEQEQRLREKMAAR